MSLSTAKVRMRPAVTAHPLVGENEFVQLNECLRFLSLQTSFVSDRLRLQPKVTTILRDQVCPSSNKWPFKIEMMKLCRNNGTVVYKVCPNFFSFQYLLILS